MQANVNGEYYYGTTDSLTFYGGMEDGFSYPYSDPETYFPYPFALGETWADSSSMSYTVSVITVIRTGSLESSCTATGSITLPGG
ncbi:MAG: hypothetical protein P8K81_05585, partial [Flavobacteriales bacterium]|nr:hypothetical protein [Flavobacteriales bacterium]